MQPIELREIPLEIKEYVGTIHSISFPRQGYTSNVGIIESNSGLFALKRTKGELYSSWLSQEISVLNSLPHHLPFPVPQVRLFIEQEEERQSWALTDYIQGETLRNTILLEKKEETRETLLFEFGKTLSRIHSINCPTELIEEKPWLERILIQAEYNFKNYNVDGTEELLHTIKNNRPKPYKQTFIHGDFTIDNVLVKDGKITGVIDWGGGTYGDPRYDVSIAVRPKPNIFEKKSDLEIFFEGYGEKIIDCQEYDYFVNGIYAFF